MIDLPILVLLGAFFVLLVASVIRTTAGFGFSLVAVPPMALLIDPVTAVIVAAIMAAPLSLWIAYKDFSHVDRRLAGLILGFGIAGVPFGVWILKVLAAEILMVVIAIVVLLGTFLVWRRVTIPGGHKAVAAVGFFSGASFASTGIDGPPMVAALQGMNLEPRVQRATLALAFAGTGLAALTGFAVSGQLTQTIGETLLMGIPALFLGIFVGERLFRQLNAATFRQVVLTLLVISSISVITRATVLA
ncbi:sulfite exporter TauE/SafE family protein [Natronoglycomyces albus]|uniref:Probable membrane transporter protein n=1 Tax=Natronoglycomyces albus TaxID=2811108 RepID=A0A895XQE3_9ACTN|nr:sulfite exporter TauE/SafE family protein [Natronoglycomyces albus]QSB04490.1 sulfite exporter TauE/SafE family protein [Natronoglycomyces albus]